MGGSAAPLGWERNIRDLTAGRHRLVARLHNAHTLVDLPRNVLRQVAVDARLRVFLHEQLRDTAPLIA